MTNILEQFQKDLDIVNAEKQKLEKVKKLAFNAISEASKQAKSELDGQCVILLQKQKTIDEQIKKINQNQSTLQKQITQWTEQIQKFNAALKQLGDANKTATVIVQDLQEIQAKLK